MKKQYSIKWIITSVLLIFVIIILVLIYVFQTNFLDDFYRINKINEMRTVENALITGIKNNDLEDTLKSVSITNEVCIRIDTGGSAITGNKKNQVCALEYLDDFQMNIIFRETRLNGGSKLFENYSLNQSGTKVEDLYILSSIFDYRGIDVMVLVSSIVAPLSPMIKTIESQFVFITLVVIVATIVLALYLSKKFVKPLTEINDQAKMISENEYDPNKVKATARELSDINETLAKSQELIKQADIARKELLSNVSHDLRTPLTMIVGYGEMIKDFKDENNEENIDVIIDEAKRLSYLVDDLLDLSKSELGQLKLHPNIVDIKDVLDNVAHQYDGYLKSLNINFIYDCKLNEKVNVDEKRIYQVLYNFINNAMNYCDKDNATIMLEAKKLNNQVLVSVYDNGQGIDKKDLEKIWDRYYKVDKEHKRQRLGSGIGLSLSKMILDAHNIKYKVESKKGEYTKFTIYIDIVKEKNIE